MYRTKISIPPDVFSAVRGLAPRSRRNFNRELKTTAQPALQREVRRLMAAPGPVVSGAGHPFEFSSDSSRRYYFARFGQDLPYRRRTPGIVAGWIVEITRSGQTSYLVVYNRFPESKYVYGTPHQRQVPGHKTTGWGRGMKQSIQRIQTLAIDLIIDAWYVAVSDAVQGKG